MYEHLKIKNIFRGAHPRPHVKKGEASDLSEVYGDERERIRRKGEEGKGDIPRQGSSFFVVPPLSICLMRKYVICM
jgi:hypothetical protein